MFARPVSMLLALLALNVCLSTEPASLAAQDLIEANNADDPKAGEAQPDLWAASHRPGDTFTLKEVGMKFAYVPAGKFMMGSPLAEEEGLGTDLPIEVELTRPFYLGIHEVTVGQFKKFVEATGYKTEGESDGTGAYGLLDKLPRLTWRTPGFKQTDDYPVTCVSWNDARAFAAWLNASSEDTNRTYRLPTEAEWEYACRAGTQTQYSFGTSLNGKEANCNGWEPYGTEERGPYLRRATKVGSYQPNAWGFYDMHGNVAEWCEDAYNTTLPGGRDPLGTEQEFKIFRGSGWADPAWGCQSAFRNVDCPWGRSIFVGFRVAMSEKR